MSCSNLPVGKSGQTPTFNFFHSQNLSAAGFRLVADAAVPLPLADIYTYGIPQEYEQALRPGMRIWVPFKNQELLAYLVSVRPAAEKDSKLKPILKPLDVEPVLSQAMLELTRWIADYYACSWGEAIENALPRWVKYGKSSERKSKNAAVYFQDPVAPNVEFDLTEAQSVIFNRIVQSSKMGKAKPILIHGVTGSGKSEIYIRSIKHMLSMSKTAICLVPEIALTEQIRRFFFHHFGDELEILHSKLSDSERFHAWKRLNEGQKKVVLGPRSAVFAPIKNLGLIIIDEEHEGTYKQETVPRYHAREVACWRAKSDGALLLMGTATPSLEIMHSVKEGNTDLLELKERVDRKPLPAVRVLDLKAIQQDRRKAMILTPMLSSEIESNLNKREGTLLLLNRRGYSTHINCSHCGAIENCPSCQVSLTYHQDEDVLLCHYCNQKKKVLDYCSQCKSPNIKFAGFGTEKIESEVAARFPQARIARMDADSVLKKGSHEFILKDFREQKIDILIGTQMIAKGFDFPHVTLVGVVLADVGLMLPDFRSAERTFQLLTQVAGRAGRGKLAGRVLIQTYSPQHPSIQFAQHHDFSGFFNYEMPIRKEFHYPPFCRLINVIVRSKDENKAYVFARSIRETLQSELLPHQAVGQFEAAGAPNAIELLGPSQLPFYKLRGHFRWHIMIKAPHSVNITARIKQRLASIKRVSGVLYAIDVDPLNIL